MVRMVYRVPPKQFHLARKLNINDPLKELNTIMKQCKDEDRREDLKIFLSYYKYRKNY